jgi:hypothetical protein
MKHENNGRCERCHSLIYLYPNPHISLVKWFLDIQSNFPEIHTSCLGRGAFEQNDFYRKGKSAALYGASPHNYNAAMDVWFLVNGIYVSDKTLYKEKLSGKVPDYLRWPISYFRNGNIYTDWPHVEVKDWKNLVSKGILKLVD